MCMTLTYAAKYMQDFVERQNSSFGNTWFHVCDLEFSGDICGLAFIRFIEFTRLHPCSPPSPDLNIISVADRVYVLHWCRSWCGINMCIDILFLHRKICKLLFPCTN